MPVDESSRARALLEQSLAAEAAREQASVDDEQIPVSEARRTRPVAQHSTGRDKTRVLFVTNDTSFLNPADEILERFFGLEDYFDEMHVMVLRAGVLPTRPVLRIRSRIWVYIASAQYWWWTSTVALEDITPEQLVFADGFRPDLIVALEPFEAAQAAQWIGKKYDRPVQIHIRRNFLTPGFRKAERANRYRQWLARWVLRRAYSVRVQTNQIRDLVSRWLPKRAAVDLLPRFNNFRALIDHTPEFDLHEKYPMYEKILLYIGPLDYNSTLFGAIDVLKYVLANPRVGLVVVGDGPIRKDCERKIKKLYLDTQVAFITRVSDPSTFLKTADVLVVTDKTAVADEIALQGAVVNLPTIMTPTEMRTEFFTDTVNAFICDPSTDTWREALKMIVHDQTVRTRLKAGIDRDVLPRLSADAAAYQRAYRDSVERVFLDGTERLEATDDRT